MIYVRWFRFALYAEVLLAFIVRPFVPQLSVHVSWSFFGWVALVLYVLVGMGFRLDTVSAPGSPLPVRIVSFLWLTFLFSIPFVSHLFLLGSPVLYVLTGNPVLSWGIGVVSLGLALASPHIVQIPFA